MYYNKEYMKRNKLEKNKKKYVYRINNNNI